MAAAHAESTPPLKPTTTLRKPTRVTSSWTKRTSTFAARA
jgi:hypothetical protein